MSKHDLQEATGPQPEESPSLSDLIHRWRTAVRVWREIDDDTDWGKDGSEKWKAKEAHYWAGHAQLMQASRLLASRLAISGFSPALMTTVLKVHESSSNAWDDSDDGKARQLAAIAATERFLKSIEQASQRRTAPTSLQPGTPRLVHDLDQALSGSREKTPQPPSGSLRQDGHATPRPKKCALAILEVLEQLPSWVDFDPDPHKWTDAQIAERMPVWRILPRHWKQGPLPSPKEKLWLAICNGTLIGWDERSQVPCGPSAPGTFDPRRITAELRIREAEVTPPQHILDAFLRSPWGRHRQVPELMVVRNEWIERAAAASVVRELVRPWIYETRRIVVQADLDPSPLDELMKSTYMQDEVVDRAVAVLRKVAPQPLPEGTSAIEGPGPEAAARKSTPRMPQGDTGKRPKREVIDSVARQALLLALKAAAENGTPVGGNLKRTHPAAEI